MKRKKRAIARMILVYAFYILLAGLIQASLPDSLTWQGLRPDLTLALAVLAGYLYGAADGFAVGLSAGFLRDVLAGRSLGLGALLLMLGGLLASVLFRHWFRRNILLGLVQTVLFTLFYEGVIVLITFMIPFVPDVTHNLADLARQMLSRLPIRLLLNLAGAVPLIFLLVFLGPYRRGSRSDQPTELLDGDSLWQAK
jgi:rod shape-determining protein MreD